MQCELFPFQEYLLGHSTPQECSQLEDHLNECSRCCQVLQQHAADDEFWSVAAEQLSESVVTLPHSKSFSPDYSRIGTTIDRNTAGTSGATMSDHTLRGQLRQWCGPSDVPGCVGRIGNYQVKEIIGRGGMGVVLKAVDTFLDRTVAIKTFLHVLDIGNESRDRLLREARAVARLKHEHIIAMHSIEQWSDVPFMVMPYVEGGTLETYGKEHSFSVDEILTVAIQLAGALATAHNARLIHRDIKPSNVLLQAGLDHVLLADFGLARVVGDQTLTHAGAAVGTPHFMSPEQATGQPVDHRCDQFSLGSVMYWMATGRPPFEGENQYAILMQLIHQSPPSISDFNSSIPTYLTNIIDRMMSKEPQARFDQMGTAVGMLVAAQKHFQDPSQPLPTELQSMGLPSRSVGWLSSPVAISLVVLTVGALIGLLATGSLPHSKWTNPSVIPDSLHQRTVESSASNDLTTETVVAEKEMSAGARLESKTSQQQGPLSASEKQQSLLDLTEGTNVNKWLIRLGELPVTQIPAELIEPIVVLSQSTDLTTRQLAEVVLQKNPFVEMNEEISEQAGIPIDATEESPFVEVDDEFLKSLDLPSDQEG